MGDLVMKSRTIRQRRIAQLTCAVVAALVFAPTTQAFGAWSIPGSGAGAGAAATMPTGGEPSGSSSGTSVALSWPVARLSSGTAVSGYVISRFNEQTGAPASVGAGCSGIVTTTSCTELSVPAGTWTYTVQPVQANWSGGVSPESAAVTVS